MILELWHDRNTSSIVKWNLHLVYLIGIEFEMCFKTRKHNIIQKWKLGLLVICQHSKWTLKYILKFYFRAAKNLSLCGRGGVRYTPWHPTPQEISLLKIHKKRKGFAPNSTVGLRGLVNNLTIFMFHLLFSFTYQHTYLPYGIFFTWIHIYLDVHIMGLGLVVILFHSATWAWIFRTLASCWSGEDRKDR